MSCPEFFVSMLQVGVFWQGSGKGHGVLHVTRHSQSKNTKHVRSPGKCSNKKYANQNKEAVMLIDPLLFPIH